MGLPLDVWSLDIETRPLDTSKAPHAALEPWRVRQGLAEISSIAVCKGNGAPLQVINSGRSDWLKEVLGVLEMLRGKNVWGHYATFDVAFLIATIEPNRRRHAPEAVGSVNWRDTKLLAKWLVNGQYPERIKFSYSLKNLCKTFMPGHPQLQAFLEVKDKSVLAGEDEAYWRERGVLDAVMTRDLAIELMSKVPPEMRVGVLTEMKCIAPVSNAWVNGIKINEGKIESVTKLLQSKMDEATEQLGVKPETLNSPKQLGQLLFTDWALQPLSYGKSKLPSTAREDLMWINYDLKQVKSPKAEKMDLVLRYKKNRTLETKYVKTLLTALGNTMDGHIYGVPNLFGTYTGRMTYSNETVDGYKVSIALHQLPRKAKEVRELLEAEEGQYVLEFDASGQESRLMAIRSRDESMVQVFQHGLNFHSMTGAAIIGMGYEEFMTELAKSPTGYFVEQRQLGKLTNLSCNYRIGGRALANKAFVDYDTFMTEETGRFLVNTFGRQYRGVRRYWDEVIRSSRVLGYTEAFGGRRYKLKYWDEEQWATESSAINFPIQGGGASMKEIAIGEVERKFPELWFALDLHDANFDFTSVDNDKDAQELVKDVVSFLDKIDYSGYWGFTPPIPLTYEAAVGKSFKDTK
jgi:DNA polymerase I-like protein with 3'-5' exonuclease and polymerase domains